MEEVLEEQDLEVNLSQYYQEVDLLIHQHKMQVKPKNSAVLVKL